MRRILGGGGGGQVRWGESALSLSLLGKLFNHNRLTLSYKSYSTERYIYIHVTFIVHIYVYLNVGMEGRKKVIPGYEPTPPEYRQTV